MDGAERSLWGRPASCGALTPFLLFEGFTLFGTLWPQLDLADGLCRAVLALGHELINELVALLKAV